MGGSCGRVSHSKRSSMIRIRGEVSPSQCGFSVWLRQDDPRANIPSSHATLDEAYLNSETGGMVPTYEADLDF